MEGFYQTPTLKPYNGNLLVDNISNIKPINSFGEKHITLDSEILKKRVDISMNPDVVENPIIPPGNSNTGVTPEKITSKQYVPPTKRKRFTPSESNTKSKSQYIPRPNIESAAKSESSSLEVYWAKLNLTLNNIPQHVKQIVKVVLEFIDIEQKKGWVKYLENHSFEDNYHLIEMLSEIGAIDAAGFLKDYNETSKLKGLAQNHERAKLLQEDPRKSKISKTATFLEAYVIEKANKE